MKKNKPLLKDKEKIILDFIDKRGGAVTPHEISKGTGISYVTVRKYLIKLIEEGILIGENNEKENNKTPRKKRKN